MDIRHLQKADMARVREVWRTCFEDTYSFIDTYFQYAAGIEQGLGIFDGKKLLSDLFSLEFSARLAGRAFPTRFIAGCATLPEARKKDCMRTLVRQALSEMKDAGYAMAYLQPFLHAFYRKFGFETVAYVRNTEVIPEQGKADSSAVVAKAMKDVPASGMRKAYAAYTAGFDNCFERSSERFDTWLRLLFSDKGKVAYLPTEEATPYVLYYEDGDTARIFEAVYFSSGERDALIHAAGKQVCKYFVPAMPDDPDAVEHTMMRVLDPAAILREYPFAPDTPPFVIYITDQFMETDYRLSVGRKDGGTMIGETSSKADIEMDIGLFAQMAAGAALMGNMRECRILFPLKSSCYFETY